MINGKYISYEEVKDEECKDEREREANELRKMFTDTMKMFVKSFINKNKEETKNTFLHIDRVQEGLATGDEYKFIHKTNKWD